jgi:hypothetical protein
MHTLTFTCLKTLANFHQLEKFEILEATIRKEEKNTYSKWRRRYLCNEPSHQKKKKKKTLNDSMES